MPTVLVVPPPTASAVLQAWGRQLADHRRSLGLSQAQLATKVELDRQTISRLERGQGSIVTLLDIACDLDLVLVEVPA